MKIEKEFYSKLKIIASVKRKKSANQRIGAKRTCYSPCRIVKIIISGEKTRP